jgi:hypothetical protein
MSSQANVYTSVSAQAWYTDKCRISTGAATVTYNVALAPGFGNTIYSNPIQIPANSQMTVYVGVGNQLTITGGTFTAEEIGTASSAQAGVN